MTTTPARELAAALAAEPSRPFLTFYDDASGERIELSLASFDNWVAKTANLLQDGLGTEPGERATIALPPHWYAAIWPLACWSAGLLVDLDRAPAPEVAVTGPESLASTLESKARDTVALALRPLGGPFEEPLPAGVWDYGEEVPAYADRFVPYLPVAAETAALTVNGTTRTAGDLVAAANDRAGELGLEPGQRLLTDANPSASDGYLDALLVPLVLRGSAVLVRHLDPTKIAAKTESEQVSRVLTGG